MGERQPDERNYNIEGVIPSLENVAATRIVIELWKQVNVIRAMEDSSWKFYILPVEKSTPNEFENLTNIINGNLKELNIPNTLRQKCSNLTKPIGLHICEWIALTQTYRPYLYITQQVKSTIWTVHGHIDKYKSIDMWLNNVKEQSKISDHWQFFFKHACCFCAENHIAYMWNMMPENIKEIFYDYPSNLENAFLINYWVSHKIRGYEYQTSLSPMHFLRHCSQQSIYLLNGIFDTPRYCLENLDYRINKIDILMFVHAVVIKYSVAAKYFFSRLTEVDKIYCSICCLYFLLREYTFTSRKLIDLFEIILYLFPKIEIRTREHYLQRYSDFFLELMVIRWPYQKFLPHLIRHICSTLDMNIFWQLLQRIYNIPEGKFVEEHLIEKIWYAVNENMKRNFFSFLSLNVSYLYELEKNIPETFLYIMIGSTIAERNSIYSFHEI